MFLKFVKIIFLQKKKKKKLNCSEGICFRFYIYAKDIIVLSK